MNVLPAPPALRPLFAFAAIALCLGLSSCQCSWKPDVGPVEEESRAVIERSSIDSAPTADWGSFRFV